MTETPNKTSNLTKRQRFEEWEAKNPGRMEAWLKDYYQKNKERIKERVRAYSRANPEKQRLRRKNWTPEQRAEKVARDKIYYQENKHLWQKRPRIVSAETKKKKSEYGALYRSEKRKELRLKNSQYKRENRDKVAASARLYRANNIQVRIKGACCARINQSLMGVKKLESSLVLLGVPNIQFYKEYLESLFSYGMTWENYGRFGWHIDHIKELFRFDLTIKEQRLEAFNYKNTRPMWAAQNCSSGALARWGKGNN